jgi:hypothetical protein
MLCFGFSYNEEKDKDGLSVEHCEEVFKYHPDRKEGIPITGNIIVKSLTEKEKYLGIWHRADVSPIKIDTTPEWTNPNNLFTHVFFNLKKNRGSISGESRLAVKLLENKTEREILVNDIAVPNSNENFEISVSDPVTGDLEKRGLDTPIPEYIPYTYAEIGPFSGKNRYYAIRVTAKIDSRSFYRFIPENFSAGIRYYRVYGVEEVIKSIIELDLPHLEKNSSDEVYKIYKDRFNGGLQNKKIIPQCYSIVAIDSLKSQEFKPSKMYAVLLREDLKDLTNEISEDFFNHPELNDLKGRVFWFVNQHQSQSFMLWLQGPMAEAKVYARSE